MINLYRQVFSASMRRVCFFKSLVMAKIVIKGRHDNHTLALKS